MLHIGQISRLLPALVELGFPEALGRAALRRTMANVDNAAAMLLSMSEVERVSLAGVQENIVQPSVEGTVSDPTNLPNVVSSVSQIWVSYLDVTRFSVVAHITVYTIIDGSNSCTHAGCQ